MAPQVLILMADYGNDPTEVATPFAIFTEAGFKVTFATERGKIPACDEKMLSGITGSLLGAPTVAKEQHKAMLGTSAYKSPTSWSDPSFEIQQYDLVFLPGGHEKGVRQYIESQTLHGHLRSYIGSMRQGKPNKNLSAICHGVQVLATAKDSDGQKSIIHDFETTALPSFMEQSIYYLTSPFLGAYYKTYGPGSPSVEEIVKKQLDDPVQWKSVWGMSPFTHRDPNYRYISGRFPGDADKLAREVVEMVQNEL